MVRPRLSVPIIGCENFTLYIALKMSLKGDVSSLKQCWKLWHAEPLRGVIHAGKKTGSMRHLTKRLRSFQWKLLPCGSSRPALRFISYRRILGMFSVLSLQGFCLPIRSCLVQVLAVTVSRKTWGLLVLLKDLRGRKMNKRQATKWVLFGTKPYFAALIMKYRLTVYFDAM